jgi:hypothetical protein
MSGAHKKRPFRGVSAPERPCLRLAQFETVASSTTMLFTTLFTP